MQAYLDANILLAYCLGPEHNREQFRNSESIFRDIQQNRYQGVISNLVLLEILNVLRRNKGSDYEILKKQAPEKQIEYVKEGSRALYEKLMRYLLGKKNIIFPDCSNIEIGNVHSQGLILLYRHFGKIRFHNYCFQCKSKKEFSVYKGLGPDDVSHILLAHFLECEKFITMDHDYELLQEEPDLEPIEIVIL